MILFLLTLATTTLAGAFFYAGYAGRPGMTFSTLILGGLWYSLPVLAILGAHEFGHYFACRYYRVDASLPYFIPFWLPLLSPGTLGAVIRIRQRIPTKQQVFDIGIAGPLAGFAVLLPILVIAMSWSEVIRIPDDFRGFYFGEPLLFRAVRWFVHGALPPQHDVNLHPAGFAAWFGLLATALNLVPVSQLDGGHISYAIFGRKSSILSVAVAIALVVFAIFSAGYRLWTGIVIVMLIAMGPHHPATFDEDVPLDRPRVALGLLAAVILIISFTPIPVALIGF